MRPKSIGIVGGAGPLAGSLLLDKILRFSGSLYGSYRDADFPKVLLYSFPFSEMLSRDVDSAKLKKELQSCLNLLRKNGADILIIACNTLHVFLEDEENLSDIVLLPKEIEKKIPRATKPLVLCTSTSRRFGLYQKLFPCLYPDAQTQSQIDGIINEVLKGTCDKVTSKKLLKVIENQSENTVILGCTELSMIVNSSGSKKQIIDPLDVAAKKILREVFSEK